jgi:hypothetical protein
MRIGFESGPLISLLPEVICQAGKRREEWDILL